MSLHALLDQCAGHDAEYRGNLSNHLPMALLALQGLGASPARMAAFAAAYAARLPAAPPPVPWPDNQHWTVLLGQREAWPAYRGLFAQWLARRGRHDTLADTLPALMAGCGGAAFHGLIRTACAWQSAHDGELADSLAYWACRHMPLDTASSRVERPDSHQHAHEDAHQDDARGHTHDPEPLLRELHARVGSAPRPQGLIADRMRHAAYSPAFVAPPLVMDDATLPRLSALAAALYARTTNFTVLHLVTSCHAVRLLLPLLGAPPAALQHSLRHSLRQYWTAYAAGFLASGIDLTQVDMAPPTFPTPWAQIVEAAVASDDEHVIKLVWSCREEHRAGGADLYRLAAAGAVRGCG